MTEQKLGIRKDGISKITYLKPKPIMLSEINRMVDKYQIICLICERRERPPQRKKKQGRTVSNDVKPLGKIQAGIGRRVVMGGVGEDVTILTAKA